MYLIFRFQSSSLTFLAFLTVSAADSLDLIEPVTVVTQKSHPNLAVAVRVLRIFEGYADRTLKRVTQLLGLIGEIPDGDLQLEFVAFDKRLSRFSVVSVPRASVASTRNVSSIPIGRPETRIGTWPRVGGRLRIGFGNQLPN